MKNRLLIACGLMVMIGPLTAQGKILVPHYTRYHHWSSNWPVHTAFGIYPYSYSNPAFRNAGSGGRVQASPAANLAMQQNAAAYRMKMMLMMEQAKNAHLRAEARAHHRHSVKAVASKKDHSPKP